MTIEKLTAFYYSLGRTCSRCRKKIKNNNRTGLCFECLYGKKYKRKDPDLDDDTGDLSLLDEDGDEE